MWMLFNPITIFHAKLVLPLYDLLLDLPPNLPLRFLQVIQPKDSESDSDFTEHVQDALASSLNIQSSNIVERDVQKWLTGIVTLLA